MSLLTFISKNLFFYLIQTETKSYSGLLKGKKIGGQLAPLQSPLTPKTFNRIYGIGILFSKVERCNTCFSEEDRIPTTLGEMAASYAIPLLFTYILGTSIYAKRFGGGFSTVKIFHGTENILAEIFQGNSTEGGGDFQEYFKYIFVGGSFNGAIFSGGMDFSSKWQMNFTTLFKKRSAIK